MNNEISLCMIVKNEEKYLPQCLNSVKDIVDEIIIVDTGSNDKTVEIAKSFGAKIYYFKWNNDFSEARNISLRYATKDWILIMDGDDEFCSEDKVKFNEILSNLNENSVYYFETLNYCGNVINSSNVTINLNPRLFKNKHGFYYTGEVHNQLTNSKYAINNENYPIRIFHYGYLNSSIKDKDKRNRNITLLKDQIEKDPNNSYAYFNLGNEYCAQNKIEEGLKCYYRAYQDFNVYNGYSFILLARIVICNMDLRKYDEALKYVDIGLKYYKSATDLYYLQGEVYSLQHRYTLAIDAFKKCLEIGEAPADLKFMYGTGTFKPLYELGNIYMYLKDYHKAFDYYYKTIGQKNDSVECVYNIGHILKEEKKPINEIKTILENSFSEYPRAYQVIGDIFYHEGYYEMALEYVEKCEKLGVSNDDLKMFKVNCLLRTGEFNECVQINNITEENRFYFQFLKAKIIAYILIEQYDNAEEIIKYIRNNKSLNNNRMTIEVYEQFVNLIEGKKTKVLSEDKKEKGYTGPIFEIFEILLVNKEFDKLELSLQLLNLISDENVLNILGKLYYKHGYTEMGKNEIVRSIKLFNIYDNEGLDILKIV